MTKLKYFWPSQTQVLEQSPSLCFNILPYPLKNTSIDCRPKTDIIHLIYSGQVLSHEPCLQWKVNNPNNLPNQTIQDCQQCGGPLGTRPKLWVTKRLINADSPRTKMTSETRYLPVHCCQCCPLCCCPGTPRPPRSSVSSSLLVEHQLLLSQPQDTPLEQVFSSLTL